jgi:hypothetical protein
MKNFILIIPVLLIQLSTYPLVRKIAAEFHVGTVSISKAPNDE